MANHQNLSRRAALRQQQEMEAKQKRTNRIIGVSASIVVLAILAVIAIVTIPPLLANRGIEVTKDQLTPPDATSGYGIMQSGKQPNDTVPNVIAYTDFLCPHCAESDAVYGPIFDQLVDEGKITLEHRTAYFMDGEQPGASNRAAIAAATADAVGKYSEYSHILFQNQDSGYTEKDLRETYAKQAGIEGEDLTKFQELLRTRAYKDFVEKSNEAFNNSGATGTPTFAIGDRQLVFADSSTGEQYIQATAESLLDAINKAQAGTDASSNKMIGT